MTQITVTRGLDIPIEGAALFPDHGRPHIEQLAKPTSVALNLDSFIGTSFRILVQPGEKVLRGQPILEDKSTPGRYFAAPAAGVVREVRRGEKRRLRAFVIDISEQEGDFARPTHAVESLSRESLIAILLDGGLFAHIRQRPFSRLAQPQKVPRAIFVKAVESAPFVPAAEWQVHGHEEAFAIGLAALKKLTHGAVHLVMHGDTWQKAFTHAQGVEHHTVSGPHPVANASLHIQSIAPIRGVEDCVWTLTARDVVCIGMLLERGIYHTDLVVATAGTGFSEKKRTYYKARMGAPISQLTTDALIEQPLRLISGDPLMGDAVERDDYLGFPHAVLTALPEKSPTRSFLHFFRLGTDKYNFSGAYLSAHLNPKTHKWPFSTSQHGEHRAFVDGSIYEKVCPLNIPPMQLVKAIMAEDYDLAEALGLLEVDPEDFALPEFVCPCKQEMVDIVRNGIMQHMHELG